jgi:hypothetical protein
LSGGQLADHVDRVRNGPNTAGRCRVNLQDRTLLGRMAKVNQSLGELTIAMLNRLDDGDLPAAELRIAGRELVMLGKEMIRHADARDQVIDSEPDRI